MKKVIFIFCTSAILLSSCVSSQVTPTNTQTTDVHPQLNSSNLPQNDQ